MRPSERGGLSLAGQLLGSVLLLIAAARLPWASWRTSHRYVGFRSGRLDEVLNRLQSCIARSRGGRLGLGTSVGVLVAVGTGMCFGGLFDCLGIGVDRECKSLRRCWEPSGPNCLWHWVSRWNRRINLARDCERISP